MVGSTGPISMTYGLWIQGLPKINLIGHFLAMYEGNYMDSKKGPFFSQLIVNHITSIRWIGIFNTADFCSAPNQQPTYMFGRIYGLPRCHVSHMAICLPREKEAAHLPLHFCI